MPCLDALAVACGAVGGSLLRYNLSKMKSSPYTIMAINISGSFLLGTVIASAGISKRTRLMVGTGFCGAYTTFSTFSVDTVKLLEQGKYMRAGALVMGTNALSIAAAMLGIKALARNTKH